VDDSIEFEKATAELPILRGFIDFVNQQVGVCTDCLSGFRSNKVRIERQKARVRSPTSTRVENGANTDAGSNEQWICRAIIVFLFAYWDEQIRPQIAAIRGVKSTDVKLDELGDLRILRHNILHNKGLLPTSEFAKLKVMKDVVAL
jgi:hypothetical protein